MIVTSTQFRAKFFSLPVCLRSDGYASCISPTQMHTRCCRYFSSSCAEAVWKTHCQRTVVEKYYSNCYLSFPEASPYQHKRSSLCCYSNQIFLTWSMIYSVGSSWISSITRVSFSYRSKFIIFFDAVSNVASLFSAACAYFCLGRFVAWFFLLVVAHRNVDYSSQFY